MFTLRRPPRERRIACRNVQNCGNEIVHYSILLSWRGAKVVISPCAGGCSFLLDKSYVVVYSVINMMDKTSWRFIDISMEIYRHACWLTAQQTCTWNGQHRTTLVSTPYVCRRDTQHERYGSCLLFCSPPFFISYGGENYGKESRCLLQYEAV